MALVNGGAILDYRTKDGSTAMHRAVAANNIEAVRTMLELGASPNYRDSASLTPVYHSVIHQTDPAVTHSLLHDHGMVGAQDLQGWQEVHQVGGTTEGDGWISVKYHHIFRLMAAKSVENICILNPIRQNSKHLRNPAKFSIFLAFKLY